MITSGADIGGMGVHPHIRHEAAAVTEGLSIVTGMTMKSAAPPAVTGLPLGVCRHAVSGRCERCASAPMSRAAKIAAIHAFADWLASPENARLPVPTIITASVQITDRDEVDEQTRLVAVKAAADHLGEHVSRGHLHQMTHYLADRHTHGLEIVYRVTGYKDHT